MTAWTSKTPSKKVWNHGIILSPKTNSTIHFLGASILRFSSYVRDACSFPCLGLRENKKSIIKNQSIQNVSMLATAILMVGLAQGSREVYWSLEWFSGQTVKLHTHKVLNNVQNKHTPFFSRTITGLFSFSMKDIHSTNSWEEQNMCVCACMDVNVCIGRLEHTDIKWNSVWKSCKCNWVCACVCGTKQTSLHSNSSITRAQNPQGPII